MNNREKGKAGENIAAEYIEGKGGEIIKRNYWTDFGEIDIIARINSEFVFIEVKSRYGNKFGSPSEAVNSAKQNRIRRAAEFYMVNNYINDLPVRFDVIEIYIKEGKINHIVNAF